MPCHQLVKAIEICIFEKISQGKKLEAIPSVYSLYQQIAKSNMGSMLDFLHPDDQKFTTPFLVETHKEYFGNDRKGWQKILIFEHQLL